MTKLNQLDELVSIPSTSLIQKTEDKLCIAGQVLAEIYDAYVQPKSAAFIVPKDVHKPVHMYEIHATCPQTKATSNKKSVPTFDRHSFPWRGNRYHLFIYDDLSAIAYQTDLRGLFLEVCPLPLRLHDEVLLSPSTNDTQQHNSAKLLKLSKQNNLLIGSHNTSVGHVLGAGRQLTPPVMVPFRRALKLKIEHDFKKVWKSIEKLDQPLAAFKPWWSQIFPPQQSYFPRLSSIVDHLTTYAYGCLSEIDPAATLGVFVYGKTILPSGDITGFKVKLISVQNGNVTDRSEVCFKWLEEALEQSVIEDEQTQFIYQNKSVPGLLYHMKPVSRYPTKHRPSSHEAVNAVLSAQEILTRNKERKT